MCNDHPKEKHDIPLRPYDTGHEAVHEATAEQICNDNTGQETTQRHLRAQHRSTPSPTGTLHAGGHIQGARSPKTALRGYEEVKLPS